MAAAVPTHVHCQTRAWGLFARGALPRSRRVSPCGRQFPTNSGENIEERRLELIKSFLAAAAALRRARSPPRKRRYKMGGIVWELDPRFAPADGESKSAPGPRLGTLTTTPWDHPAPCSVPTPIALTYTRRGEPAHLTPDNVDELPREARSFHVSLAHFLDHLGPDHVGNHPGGGRRYFGSRPTCMLVTARDPLTFDQDAKPSNTDAHTFVASPTGTTKITTDDYARWIAAIQPDAFVALADESPCWEQGVAMKKTKQATARTAKWLGELLEKTKDLPTAPSVFASVQGGSDAGERRACSLKTSWRDSGRPSAGTASGAWARARPPERTGGRCYTRPSSRYRWINRGTSRGSRVDRWTCWTRSKLAWTWWTRPFVTSARRKGTL